MCTSTRAVSLGSVKKIYIYVVHCVQLHHYYLLGGKKGKVRTESAGMILPVPGGMGR